MNNSKNILEINEAEFQEQVIEASSSALILIDFWAPWCGPCKQLTPLLEKIVSKGNDKVKLVKINIDENKQIASQMRVQSIPAVFAFKDGQPVDAFQGIIPEKKIIEFIEKSLGEKLVEDFVEFYENISNLFLENKYDEAKESLESFISDQPNEHKSFALYIECLTNLLLFDEALSFSKSLTDEIKVTQLVNASIQNLNIKIKNSNGPTLQEILKEHQSNKHNINTITKLSDKYFAENMLDESFGLLLDNFSVNKEVIKKKILEYFEALGNENPKTSEYRKKFSSLIFS